MVWEVHAVPAVPLIKQPAWQVTGVFGELLFALWSIEWLPGEAIFVSFFRGKIGVNRLVGQVQAKWLIAVLLLLQEFDGVPSQQSRDVSVLLHSLTVDVDCVFGTGRKVIPLPTKADPVVKTGAGIIVVATHVPLANKSSRVASLLKVLGKELRAFRNQSIIVNHSVPERIQARQNGGTAGRTQ